MNNVKSFFVKKELAGLSATEFGLNRNSKQPKAQDMSGDLT
jgi:hypothetical protein